MSDQGINQSSQPSSPPETAPSAPMQPQVQYILREQGSVIASVVKYGFYAFMAIIMLGGMFNANNPGANGLTESYHSLAKDGTKKIALIHLEGAIMKGEGFVKKQLECIREDENVVAIVVRINSPGGTVSASDYIYHHLKDLAKERQLPLVVSMGGICASGGYYVAMAVGENPDTIYAENTTWTGSIGVVIPHYDFSGLLAEYNVKDDSIVSHRFKQMGSPTRTLDEAGRTEERQLLQSLVDDSFEGFKEIVRSGRPKFRKDEEALNSIATGQIFTASQAKEKGLIDKIGFLDDAIQRAVVLSGLPDSAVQCVEYKRPVSPLESFLSGQVSARPTGIQLDVSSLIELTTPRAYYIHGTFPMLHNN